MSDAPERIWATHDLRNGYYFTASGPQLRFEDVEYVRADRIEELETENHLLKTSGIIEVAARNPNVMEYIKHWEGRAEAAEAALAKALDVLETFKAFDDLPTAAKRPDVFEIKVRKPILRTLAELTGGKDE